MTFTLTIDCGNAAFEEYPQLEISRILSRLVPIPTNKEYGTLTDANGNSVGEWELSE